MAEDSGHHAKGVFGKIAWWGIVALAIYIAGNWMIHNPGQMQQWIVQAAHWVGAIGISVVHALEGAFNTA